MSTVFRCDRASRKRLVRDTALSEGGVTYHLNGVDWVELFPASPYGGWRLEVHCLQPVASTTAVGIEVVGSALSLPVYTSTIEVGANPDILVVHLTARGDDGPYTLRVVNLEGATGAQRFDPQLCEVGVSFQAGCPCDDDCAALAPDCAPEAPEEPVVDYTARDAASLRRLLFDRLSLTLPGWTERHPADLGVALVELFAHVGDRLSYHQDAVATEAYLGTARRRTSVRRHARLVDYHLHEGCNARAWVHLVARGASTVPAGTPVRAEGGDVVFETTRDLAVHEDLNALSFYTWDADVCALPRGATRATLRWPAGSTATLRAGDLLLLEARVDPETGHTEDADPTRRQVVRLRAVGAPAVDPLHAGSDPVWYREVTWDDADALPFALTVSALRSDGLTLVRDVSVARGNIALADHGATSLGALRVPDDAPDDRVLRVPLEVAGVTWRARLPGDDVPASSALAQDPRAALPELVLREAGGGPTWTPQRDLLASRTEDRHFVVECEGDACFARFGDGAHGRRPAAGQRFEVAGRAGNGRAGCVGADALRRVHRDGVVGARNPLPSAGGLEPEDLATAKRDAPIAFRRQERAVTPDDWVALAERHPEVQRAVAAMRWTGSWRTVSLTVDRRGTRDLDDAFCDALRAWLEPYRLAGYDLDIEAPQYVPIELRFRVCVRAGYFRERVRRSLMERFSAAAYEDGRRGLFHPDNLTFGQSLFLSVLLREAAEVPGVSWVQPLVFGRMHRAPSPPSTQWPSRDELTFSRLEIPRLDNLTALPLRGRVDFVMQGGI